MTAKKITKKEANAVERALKKPVKKPVPKKRSKTPKVKVAKDFDPFKVLLYPHLAEKSAALVDTQNKIVFIVNPKATKADVKKAVESAFGVKVASVNVEQTNFGEKKAYVKLHPSSPAVEVATKLGMI